MNSSALKYNYTEQKASKTHALDDVSQATVSETVVQMETRTQMIARQSEDACNIPGNICGPDLGTFEEKYGISDFA